MNVRVGPSITALMLVAAVSACAPLNAAPPALVEIHDGKTEGGFEPTSLTVPVGTEVRWKNMGAHRHGVTTAPADATEEQIVPVGAEGWESDVILPGETFALRFETAGTYIYRCSIHGEVVGVIRVEEER